MRRTELVKHFLQDKNARRRGLGIEIALLVLLAAVALSALLVSSAMLERNGLKDREAETLERLALDQIGEDFLAGKITAVTGEGEDYNGYEIAECEQDRLLLVTDANGKWKLKVELSGGKVTGWTYHNLGTGG